MRRSPSLDQYVHHQPEGTSVGFEWLMSQEPTDIQKCVVASHLSCSWVYTVAVRGSYFFSFTSESGCCEIVDDVAWTSSSSSQSSFQFSLGRPVLVML
jgi:hypothetical protein